MCASRHRLEVVILDSAFKGGVFYGMTLQQRAEEKERNGSWKFLG